MDFGKKISAARAVLDWNMDKLADASGLSKNTIQKVENGSDTTAKTQEKLERALNRAGIVLTPEGIMQPDSTITRLDGEGWFVEVLEDAYYTLLDMKPAEREMLIFGGNNQVSTPQVIDGFRRLRSIGVTIREMVEEGNAYLNGPEEHYRWIPSAYFKNYVTVIYGDKVLNDFHSHGILFTSKEWAKARRNEFNLTWSLLPELAIKSTANVRY